MIEFSFGEGTLIVWRVLIFFKKLLYIILVSSLAGAYTINLEL